MSFSVVQLLGGLSYATTLFLMAAGLTLIFGVTRIVNFAHGSFFMLGALFTSGRFSANLRQSFQGKSMVLVFPGISGLGPYEGVVKATPLTDLELGYDLTDWMSFSVGANNLFNKRPEIPALLPSSVTIPAGVSPYINGGTTINSPYGHGAYGSNGGYYYARLNFKF